MDGGVDPIRGQGLGRKVFRAPIVEGADNGVLNARTVARIDSELKIGKTTTFLTLLKTFLTSQDPERKYFFNNKTHSVTYHRMLSDLCLSKYPEVKDTDSFLKNIIFGVHFIYLKNKMINEVEMPEVFNVVIPTNSGDVYMDLFTTMMFFHIDLKALKEVGGIYKPDVPRVNRDALYALRDYLYRGTPISLSGIALFDFMSIVTYCKSPELREELIGISYTLLTAQLANREVPFDFQKLGAVVYNVLMFFNEKQKVMIEELFIINFLAQKNVKSDGKSISVSDLGVLDTFGINQTPQERIVFDLIDKHIQTLVVKESDSAALEYIDLIPVDTKLVMKHIIIDGNFTNIEPLKKLKATFTNVEEVELKAVSLQNAIDLPKLLPCKPKSTVKVHIMQTPTPISHCEFNKERYGYYDFQDLRNLVNANYTIVNDNNIGFAYTQEITNEEKQRLLHANPKHKLVIDDSQKLYLLMKTII